MKQPENINTFPLPDTHLRGAAILACSIIDHEETVMECRKEREDLHRAISELQRVVDNIFDLFTQMDLALQLAVAAKEHPQFKVPDWFFQAEATDTVKMLTRRARYLWAAGLDVNETWDLLKEFTQSAKLPFNEIMLKQIVIATYGRKDQ